MCTIAILLGVAGAPLVLAANRDELYARPTRSPETLGPGIAGGVDELSGGTWFAIRRDGTFAAVTNQRTLASSPPGTRSRGLVVRELVAAADPDRYVAALDPRGYASMNLVWGNAERVSIAYLRHDDGLREVETLPAGIHVLCNDRLAAPGFPRAERLERAIRAALSQSRAWPQLSSQLAIALGDHEVVAPADVPPSHLAPDLARALTATCIHSPLYGTRSATLAAIERGGVAAYLHAEGSPCTHAFETKLGLLT